MDEKKLQEYIYNEYGGLYSCEDLARIYTMIRNTITSAQLHSLNKEKQNSYFDGFLSGILWLSYNVINNNDGENHSLCAAINDISALRSVKGALYLAHKIDKDELVSPEAAKFFRGVKKYTEIIDAKINEHNNSN